MISARSILAAATLVMALSGAAMLGGCETITKNFGGGSTGKDDPNKTAYVKVSDPDAGSDVLVTVKSRSSSGGVAMAIKHLQNEEYEKARTELETVIAGGDKSYEAQFALAVTLEKLGRLDDAIARYKEANIAKSEIAAQNGRQRCEAKRGS